MKENKSDMNVWQVVSKYRLLLMGFAALWILVFHTWEQVFSTVRFLHRMELVTVRIGFCGVDIFLFLSGMGLHFAAKKKPTVLKFYYRRIRRILLPFLIIGVINGIRQSWSLAELLKRLSGYSFFTESIYSLLWFVPAICTLYLFFPLYHKLFDAVKNKTLFTAGVIALWLVCSLLAKDWMREDLYGFTNRIPIFVTGILCGHYAEKEDARAGRRYIGVVAAIFIVGFVLSYCTNFLHLKLVVPASNCCIPNYLMSLSLCPLLASLLEVMREKNIISRFLGFVGTISFELYCVQELLYGVLIAQYVGTLRPMVINLMAFGLVVAAGSALYLLNRWFWKAVDALCARRTGK